MISIVKKPDIFGAWASSLCLVHCIATPFIFIAQSCTSTCCGDGVPTWWSWLDYLFLIISFVAILWSSRTTSKKWMAWMLWMNWFVLMLMIVNERFEWVHIDQFIYYAPAISLTFFHLYNRKYCQCSKAQCCTIKTEENE